MLNLCVIPQNFRFSLDSVLFEKILKGFKILFLNFFFKLNGLTHILKVHLSFRKLYSKYSTVNRAMQGEVLE